MDDKISGLKTEVESGKSKVAALEDRVARLEEIVSQITSISYIPRYADGAERVEYTRDALDIIPGDVTLRFDVHPASSVSEIAANWESILSARAVYTLTKADAGDFVDLKIKGATAENGVLSVTVSGEGLNKDFILGNISASANVKVTASGKNAVSDYVEFIPSFTEEQKFIYYLLNNFDTDGDGSLELTAVENATELNISDMGFSTLAGVLDQMPNLKVLDCSKNNLSSIDLSKNELLTKLDCSNNGLSNLDLRQNTSLKELDCSSNKLLYLDLSNNESLFDIDFSNNDDLIGVKSAGLEIDGVKWMIYNCGTTSTASYGNLQSTGASPELTYAAASVICPSGWRLPTKDELISLCTNYSNWISYKGIIGRWFSGSNSYSTDVNRVFLPKRLKAINEISKHEGSYWSNTQGSYSGTYGDSGYRQYVLRFDDSQVSIAEQSPRAYDGDARCVKDK